jgi:hypothetical protein
VTEFGMTTLVNLLSSNACFSIFVTHSGITTSTRLFQLNANAPIDVKFKVSLKSTSVKLLLANTFSFITVIHLGRTIFHVKLLYWNTQFQRVPVNQLGNTNSHVKLLL